jgi:putative oxidoreductase
MQMLMLKMTQLQKLGKDILLLIIRLWIANIFIRAGVLKLLSWDTTLSLFETEYHLPFLPTNVAAIMGTTSELIGGTLVLLGFLTPLGALILLGITATIELFIYPGTTDHYHWIMLLAVLIFFGAGRFSLDKLIIKWRF